MNAIIKDRRMMIKNADQNNLGLGLDKVILTFRPILRIGISMGPIIIPYYV